MPTPRGARRGFAALEARRFHAARLFARGESQAAVARTLAVTPITAGRWYRAWKARGRPCLKAAGRAGRKPRVKGRPFRATQGRPKRLPAWLTGLDLSVPVHLHWLPVSASWLDQIEIVFSELQRKALTPNDFESTAHVRQRILGFFAERNRRARPIRWTYTGQKLLGKVRRQRRLATTG